MELHSTRDSGVRASFSEAVFRGLAPDGGLYQPASFPDLTDALVQFTPGTSFIDIASRLSAELLREESDLPDTEAVCRRAFSFAPKLTEPEPGLRLLELFHGPSCAFKDFGASFLASVMEALIAVRNRRAVILTATSGDTGSAVARAFQGKDGIDCVILYPSGRVSPLQEKQLTTIGGNIRALEVRGSFDDCQAMVKSAFVNERLTSALPLTSANSINIGRLLPQAFYYIFAWSQLGGIDRTSQPPAWICVPSGNFGNLTAGLMAWRWGMKIDGFIAATNANDVVPQYLETGIYRPRASVKTLSNAMDVGAPSNFERLTAIFDGNTDRIRSMIRGEVVTDEETTEEIRRVYERTGTVLDPHTAVGYLSAERMREAGAPETPLVVTLATAHPAKFLEIVEPAIGVRPEIPAQIADVLDKRKVATIIDNTPEALAEFLMDSVR